MGQAIEWSGIYAERAERMRASEIRELLKLLDQPDVISFAGGIPDPMLFPTEDLCPAPHFSQRNQGRTRSGSAFPYRRRR